MKIFKIQNFILPLVAVVFLIISCQTDKTTSSLARVEWKIDSIQLTPERLTHITTTIYNNTAEEFSSSNWSFNYNHLGGRVLQSSMPEEISIINKAGDYFTFSPTSAFQSILPGSSRTFKYAITGTLDKFSEAPKGMFLVLNGKAQPIEFNVIGFDENTLSNINPATARTRYQKNERLFSLPKSELLPLIPAPSFYKVLEESKVLGSIVSISASEELTSEVQNLEVGLNKIDIEIVYKEEADITLALNQSLVADPESYNLRIDKSGITISANSKSGIFYGCQSLLQLIYNSKLESPKSELSLQGIEINDTPRFGYRGLHLDVARNFHSKQSVLKLLDVLSFFKINKFHFHITDDEGWRLEIPELPELTDIGSKRGHTDDESDQLIPSYGSGFDAGTSYGSGYYSRQDFIEILKYAKARHIEVITEVDMPGHARASIIAMKARMTKHLALGDTTEAHKYQLHDPDDQSKYGSAQNWSDNVVCICQDGAYEFMDKVLTEIITMYEEADAPLTTFHIGGDELPYGAWQKSPICEQFIADKSLSDSDDLPGYFFNWINDYLNKKGLITAGWEEMVLAHNEKGHHVKEINQDFIGKKMQPYVWNAMIGGGREDMVYKLANAGFPVVMCNSSSFYFDMAYDRDPDEIGLTWSGYADTEKAYGVEPMDILYRRPSDRQGNALTDEYVLGLEKLTPHGEKNFLGIQAQVWSETILDEIRIEYLVFPKLLGFSERAWSPQGSWMVESDPNKIEEIYQNDWNVFANTMGLKTLPIVDHFFKIQYRIPEPGAQISNGYLVANTSIPGHKIVYKNDLDTEEKVYNGPVRVSEGGSFSLRSVSSSGRAGRWAKVK